MIRLQVLILLLTFSGVAIPAEKAEEPKAAAEITGKQVTPVLWQDPGDLASRDLFYGPGGKKDAPTGTTFKFVKEDVTGSNPKYTVVDPAGVKWKVKLGPEAKPETAASRLVWAMGYFTNEDYFLPELHVTGMPSHLKRGGGAVAKGVMKNARLKREQVHGKDSEPWAWKDDPFKNTREWNGLRVLMALINNWDVKDENNATYPALINNWDVKDENNATYLEERAGRGSEPERIYMVSDLGATFGTTGLALKHDTARGNLNSYKHSKFITKTTDDYVNFATPSHPTLLTVFNPYQFMMRIRLRWVGRHIPRSDAKWMAGMLARLSPDQIRDAFRAAGYSPEETAGFAEVLQDRIAQLSDL